MGSDQSIQSCSSFTEPTKSHNTIPLSDVDFLRQRCQIEIENLQNNRMADLKRNYTNLGYPIPTEEYVKTSQNILEIHAIYEKRISEISPREKESLTGEL